LDESLAARLGRPHAALCAAADSNNKARNARRAPLAISFALPRLRGGQISPVL